MAHLTICIDNGNTFFLQPRSVTEVRSEQILAGILVVHLDRLRKAKEIVIRLRSEFSVFDSRGKPGKTECLLERRVLIPVNASLTAGSHSFPLSLFYPIRLGSSRYYKPLFNVCVPSCHLLVQTNVFRWQHIEAKVSFWSMHCELLCKIPVYFVVVSCLEGDLPEEWICQFEDVCLIYSRLCIMPEPGMQIDEYLGVSLLPLFCTE